MMPTSTSWRRWGHPIRRSSAGSRAPGESPSGSKAGGGLTLRESGRRRTWGEPMKSKIVLAIVIAWLAAASEAMAQNYCELEKIRVQSEGAGAFADFSSVDTSTCALGIETTVHIESSEGARRITDRCGRGGHHFPTVTHTAPDLVGVTVHVYARCLAPKVFPITATGEPEDFHVSQNLRP